MRRIDPDEQAVAEHLKQLYESFEDGFAFEQFLKGLLIEMGLQDVTVTRKSNDGGIDLTAVRPGLDALSRLDEVAYKVQAKRYAPERSVRIETLRALRGVVSHHQKGLFITTGKFPPRAEQFAAADSSRPLVLIDGVRLVTLCIDHEIGFRFRPVFDEALLGLPIAPTPTVGSLVATPSPEQQRFLKTITANDIRANIISVPRALGERFSGTNSLTVEFPPEFPPRPYKYRPGRMFISSVTDVLRRFGLLGQDGSRNPRPAEWIAARNSDLVRVVISRESSPLA